MHDHEPKNYICPMCQIVRGEPTTRGSQHEDIIFANEQCTAFVAGKWWRAAPAHVIIIPNEHIENIYALPEIVGRAIFDASKRIAIALKETYACDGISLRQHNEPAGDQSVWHYHLHVFPRYEGKNLYATDEDAFWPTAEEKRPYVEKLERYLANKS
jgi:histidine triad (HIT) family protein